VYDTAFNTKDNFQCVSVLNPTCSTEEYTFDDKTCRTTTTFDCPTSAAQAYGSDSSYGNAGSSTVSYGSASSTGMSGGDSYGSHGSTDSYGSPSYDTPTYETPKCRRSQSTKCYNTPRTASVQKCGHASEKVCEKMPEQQPFAQEKQNCHNEDKKVSYSFYLLFICNSCS
jgi:hypothetical protein